MQEKFATAFLIHGYLGAGTTWREAWGWMRAFCGMRRARVRRDRDGLDALRRPENERRSGFRILEAKRT